MVLSRAADGVQRIIIHAEYAIQHIDGNAHENCTVRRSQSDKLPKTDAAALLLMYRHSHNECCPVHTFRRHCANKMCLWSVGLRCCKKTRLDVGGGLVVDLGNFPSRCPWDCPNSLVCCKTSCNSTNHARSCLHIFPNISQRQTTQCGLLLKACSSESRYLLVNSVQ